ncbi:MAG: DUF3333 domain-containing protein, partial [Bdellovibrionales bacterium]|nr:DUF3333 domain-containing protein [Bdellovibrionales bacterium]
MTRSGNERNPEMELARERRLRARHRAERRFRLCGMCAVSVALISLAVLVYTIASSGLGAFYRTELVLDVTFDRETLGVPEDIYSQEKTGESELGSVVLSDEVLENLDYYTLALESLYAQFPSVTSRTERRELKALMSNSANLTLQDLLASDRNLLGKSVQVNLLASSDLDQIHKGNAPIDIEESRRLLNDAQLGWYQQLVESGRVLTRFNWSFFTRGDSRSPELAGIGGAIKGSVLTLVVCLLLSFPIGVAAALYLEEFAPKNRITEIIEININNLAAVPSIIFGLLGLAVLLNVVGLPRGTPLVGGVVLALMTLPTIIISCRSALRAVPPSIREGALAMGAS